VNGTDEPKQGLPGTKKAANSLDMGNDEYGANNARNGRGERKKGRSVVKM